MVKADYEALLHSLLDGQEAALRVLDRAQMDGELDLKAISEAKHTITRGFIQAIEALGQKPPADE